MRTLKVPKLNDISYLKNDLTKLEELIPREKDNRLFEKLAWYINQIPDSSKDPLINQKVAELVQLKSFEDNCKILSKESPEIGYSARSLEMQKIVIIHELKQLMRLDSIN